MVINYPINSKLNSLSFGKLCIIASILEIREFDAMQTKLENSDQLYPIALL